LHIDIIPLLERFDRIIANKEKIATIMRRMGCRRSGYYDEFQ